MVMSQKLFLVMFYAKQLFFAEISETFNCVNNSKPQKISVRERASII